ncbi:tetratricopeptide repeat protein [Yinghuangia soli]|uniref:Tetratricopeptide repeat protein n=1 Tax=Yinghuangia soli TaxID=2908204 RepID=A0AA41Q938_9ACTN|nr:tetratricopeptide repeat protein [Yinghuangia soli]MCF2533180.1 tetratricopeptide repeat protein [Yinghuangia soli]
MDRARVVALEAAGRRVSGYEVAPRLTLTCAHDVPALGGKVEAFNLASRTRRNGRVVWRGTPGGVDDVALVEITDPAWQSRARRPVRWGRIVTDRPGTVCETWGFPQALSRADGTADTGHLTGRINIGNSYRGNRYVMDIDQFPPDQSWSGMSGAALFCGDLLTGVVFEEPGHSQHAQLRAVPLTAPLRTPEFRTILQAHGVDSDTRAVEFHHLAEPDEPEIRTPAALLRAHREVVAFRGRTEILAELGSWCRSDWPFDVRLIHGPGGQGKTRLAHELGNRLRNDRWESVWLRKTDGAEDLSVLAAAAVPLLVVVDYAETRLDLVAETIEICERTDRQTPIRLLLLARTAGEWCRHLASRSPVAAEVLSGMARTVLPALEPGSDDRATAYRSARSALAARLGAVPARRGRAAPDWADLDAALPVPPLAAAPFAGALTLHTTALADLLDAAYPDPAPDGPRAGPSVEDRLLDHERSYWRDAAVATGLAPLLGFEALEDALAAAFLTGAATLAEADALLARLPRLAEESSERRARVRDWIAGVYPPARPPLPWDTLQPDRIAERLVGIRLAADPGLAEQCVADTSAEQLDRTLAVYARAAAQPAFAGCLDASLTALVVSHESTLAEVAVDTATHVERPAPLLHALNRIAGAPDTTDERLRRLSARTPQSSHALAEWAELVTTRLVANARSAQHSPDLATALGRMSIRLANLGRTEDALAALEEAVGIQRDLAAERPDLHLPGLAASLNNMSVRLGELGRVEEALATVEEAADAYRRLAGEDPDTHLSALSSALSNTANRLSSLGRAEEALAPAQEALAIQRRLAEEQPAAHLPGLAASLNTVSIVLASVDRAEEGLAAVEEAADISRRLAEARPDLYLPDLAGSLNNMSIDLAGMGRTEEALTAIEEAAQAYRRLAAVRPDAYLPDLAMALNNMSNRLAALGRAAEGLAAIEEAVALRREFDRETPGRLPDQSRHVPGELGSAAPARGPCRGCRRRHRGGHRPPHTAGDPRTVALRGKTRTPAGAPGVLHGVEPVRRSTVLSTADSSSSPSSTSTCPDQALHLRAWT